MRSITEQVQREVAAARTHEHTKNRKKIYKIIIIELMSLNLIIPFNFNSFISKRGGDKRLLMKYFCLKRVYLFCSCPDWNLLLTAALKLFDFSFHFF